MFLFRSLFWLTLAFLVIAPAAQVDVEETARTAPWAVLNAVSTHVPQIRCESLECEATRAMLTAATSRQAAAVSQPMPELDAEDGDVLAALITRIAEDEANMVAPRPLPRPASL